MLDFLKRVFETIVDILNEVKIGLCIGLGFYLVVSLLGINIFKVSGDSMMSTLVDGQSIMCMAYHGDATPEINDIIVFQHQNKSLVKRVVGVAGDVIYFKDGDMYRNDEIVIEEYLDEGMETFCRKEEVFVVPEGEIFVLGDNRINSLDSRSYEDPYVDIDDIDGRMIFEF